MMIMMKIGVTTLPTMDLALKISVKILDNLMLPNNSKKSLEIP